MDRECRETYIINNLAFKIEDGVMHDYLLPGFTVKPQFVSTHTHNSTNSDGYLLRTVIPVEEESFTASRLKINYIFSFRYPHHPFFSCCSFSCALSRVGSKNHKSVLSLRLLLFYHFHYHSKTSCSHWRPVFPIWALASVRTVLISQTWENNLAVSVARSWCNAFLFLVVVEGASDSMQHVL